MKRILFIIFILLFEGVLSAQVHVKGYFRKDGTYVQPHSRTVPDGNPYNNYSFPGNYNPNTGEITKGNPDTYLNNYYNRNVLSGYSSKSNYIPATNSDDINSLSSPNSYINPINASLSTIKTEINQIEHKQVDIKEIDELIEKLIALKQEIIKNEYNSSSQTNIKNRYYIIVYSETERRYAEERLNNCTNKNILSKYKYTIYPAVVNGRQWYRVALGEFTTYSEAKSKLKELYGVVPNDSWVFKY